jgi:spore maturation protein CgeB
LRIFAALPRSAWVDLNLRRTLEEMGHTLVRFDFPGWPDDADPVWQRVGKPRTNERMLAAFHAAQRSGRIDLFYGYLYSSVVYPETIQLIRQAGVPTVNFSCNNVHQFDLVEAIAPFFDVCVVPEQAAQAAYRGVGARPVRIQLAANPRVYRPYPEPRIYDVTFVGQRYADRADFLQHLHRNGVQVRAWGAGWQSRKHLNAATLKAGMAFVEDEGLYGLRRVLRSRLQRGPTSSGAALAPSATLSFGGPRLMHAELVRTFSQSRMSLGFATAGDSHIGPKRLTHLRLREFEAPMSAALYLTERQEELAEYFCVGREVLAYTDRDDLLEQVRYYLAHPEQAERIRRAGYHRARRDHTWQQRFRDLFAVLGIAKA